MCMCSSEDWPCVSQIFRACDSRVDGPCYHAIRMLMHVVPALAYHAIIDNIDSHMFRGGACETRIA